MDGRGSVPMSSHISIEEFLEQRGTDHPAPRGGGGAGTHHCGELLGEDTNACKRLGRHTFYQVWCSRRQDVVLKAVFQPKH